MTTTSIEPIQLKRIQANLTKSYPDRDERLSFVSHFLNREVTSTKQLSSTEANELLQFIYNNNYTRNNWGLYNMKQEKYQSERKLLWSYLYQAQWTVPNERHGEVPDTERLSNFLKSPKSPVNKPLKQFTKTDWEKILFVFNKIVKGTFK